MFSGSWFRWVLLVPTYCQNGRDDDGVTHQIHHLHFANATDPAQWSHNKAHQQHDGQRTWWQNPMASKKILNGRADKDVIRCAKAELGKGHLPGNQEIAIASICFLAQERIGDVMPLVALTQK